jgi:hypothetical protein
VDRGNKFEKVCDAARKGENELKQVIESGISLTITNEVNK